MNKSYEVEYCNLELRFERRDIQNLIRDLIKEGYSLYWRETEDSFIVSIRTDDHMTKLRFQQTQEGYKLIGDYRIHDARLAEWMEKLIGDTKGHAIVKRFRDQQILVENILFGEVIRMVEISGFEQRILYQKESTPTRESLNALYMSTEGEQRIEATERKIDESLDLLNEAIKAGDTERVEECKKVLENLRFELVRLEK
ncbi:hypothetical protein [Paenibacillus bovis]|uniref:Uncharacterized protein n=1 Tax=Paenibacillus bovis TaxID=1616788 RepID=A0A172ZJ78_9BACL|nr:hypothetical protein [Paenibacillus bovis]ANF97648.1 hypothetical protein AR543_17625 [Paenibacillus bovis]